MNVLTHFDHAQSEDNTNTNFLFCWHGHTIAFFSLAGKKEWQTLHPSFDDLFVMDPTSRLPMFLTNLRPEGWLADHLDYDLQTDYIRDGRRFLSNVVIYHGNGRMDFNGTATKTSFMLDEKLTGLENFVDEQGMFVGQYKAPSGMNDDPAFEENLIEFWENKYMPRFSGAELKLPVCLSEEGHIEPALEKPFNVIAKYPGGNGYEALGANEFLSMRMARAAGLDTPPFALVDQGNGLPPLYIIERYDIPTAGEKNHWLITQDFCTLMQKPGGAKTSASIEQIGKKIREVSKLAKRDEGDKNVRDLFDRTALAWIINDDDLHMKNISMLYAYNPNKQQLDSIRFAPCYDATTNVFSGKGGSTAALSLNGKKNNIKMKTFVGLARSLGVFQDANGNVDEAALTDAVQGIARKAAQEGIDFTKDMPDCVRDKPWTYDIMVQVSHVVDRARALGVDGLDWNSEAVWKDHGTKGPVARRNAALNVTAQKARRLDAPRFANKNYVPAG